MSFVGHEYAKSTRKSIEDEGFEEGEENDELDLSLSGRLESL